jgi:hypothetical protein
MKTSFVIRLALSLAVAGVAAAAHAQYIWLDEHGVKQFSDQPPPSNVPKKSILKEPARTARSMSETEADDSGGDEAEKAPKTIEDKNADYIKRQIAKAEKDKKDAAQAKQEAEKTKNCARTREYQHALTSGEKVSSTDENGERVFMSDEQRAQDMEENRQILQDCQ